MIDQIHELVSKYGDQLALVANVSGGKDSTRMLGYLRENFPQQPMYVVYSDTGFEHVRPVTAEQFARERAAAFGLKLDVVRHAHYTFHSMIEARFAARADVPSFPSSKQRFCTSGLKRDVIRPYPSSSAAQDSGQLRRHTGRRIG